MPTDAPKAGPPNRYGHLAGPALLGLATGARFLAKRQRRRAASRFADPRPAPPVDTSAGPVCFVATLPGPAAAPVLRYLTLHDSGGASFQDVKHENGRTFTRQAQTWTYELAPGSIILRCGPAEKLGQLVSPDQLLMQGLTFRRVE